MSIAIPQVITSDRASGAQVIDGSLRIDSTKNHYLKRTFASGNRKTFTISAWVKRSSTGGVHPIFARYTANSEAGFLGLYINSDDNIYFTGWSTIYLKSDRLYRDTNGWSNIVLKVDTTQSTASDRIKLYFNGELQTLTTYNAPSEDADLVINENVEHRIGNYNTNYFNGQLSQVYFIDGQALEPENFGFTDLLTNTWRPKKYTGTYGTNGFWLPMDGNSPIGEDKSGQGNDFTPVNFGGSVALDNPQVSGARPILNTLPGGTQAAVGVFGSKENKTFAVTVASVGGGNRYHFDGVDRPNPTLIRGVTYTFDQSDNSNNNHPLRFSTTSNGSHGGGSEYTNGVSTNGTPGQAGAYTKITVPHNAPDTLYYYCTQHSGMGSSTSQITDETKADKYAANCVLALPLVGVKDDVSASITCTSTTKVMTSVGNAAAAYESSNFYTGSFEFDGSGDGITCPDNTNFEFGSGDFTVECWVKQDDTSGFDVFVGKYGGSSDGEFILGKNGNTPTFYWQDSSGNANINATNFRGNTSGWYHIAGVREGNVFTLYVNGVCENSTTDSTTIKTTSNKLTIGIENDQSSSPFDGYLQDVRIYKGVAKYSGTTVGTQYFVPAATSPDILPDTPSGVSGGSKLAKVTDGAVSFDGSGDYLSIADSADFELGSGDFTIEFFAYPKSLSSDSTVISKYSSSNRSYLVWMNSTTVNFTYSTNGSSNAASLSVTYSVPLNKWTYFAMVRDGSTLNMFIDGMLVASPSISGTLYDGSFNLQIGKQEDSTPYYWNGFISNVRIIKGTALYTTDFTPPTRALTNVTNTKLLCCQSTAGQQNNFIRMFLSDTLYTTKADILANATEVGDGESGISNKYWYIVPTGTEPIGSDVFTNDGSVTTPHGSNTFALYWRNGSSWTQTIGTYAASEYSDFDYKSDDSSSTYSVYPARDFYVFGADDSPSEPKLISGTLPTRAKYYIFDGAVKPGTIIGNGDAATTNFNPFNTDINTVRGQETGYPTWNPLDKGSGVTLSDGNLNASVNGGSNNSGVRGTMVMPQSGKYFFVIELSVIDDAADTFAGLMYMRQADTVRDLTAGGTRLIVRSGSILNDSSSTAVTGLSAGDELGVAVDCDTNTVQFYLNSVTLGSTQTPSVSITEDWAPYCGTSSGTSVFVLNAGQKPFKFSPPAGFQPLNLANVRPETVIARPDQFVGVTTYPGDGTSVVVSDYQFKPDFVWIKGYTDPDRHGLYDTVRGATKRLQSAENNEEDTQNGVMSFDDKGFSIGNYAETNGSGRGYVAWCWKAGGNSNTFNVDDVGYASAAAAGLDGGSINPTGASVGTKQGFSILKYQGNGTAGANISHGLLEAPKLMIHKSLDQSRDWYTITTAVDGSADYLYLNTTAVANNSAVTAPTSSLMYFTSSVESNNNNENYVVYMWHDVPGLQKFGSYKGTGSAPNYVHLGFRPALIITKNAGTNGSPTNTNNWLIQDSTRNTFNQINDTLYPNLANQEANSSSNFGVDFLSDGFALRTTGGYASNSNNASEGHTFIYAAWAEAPTVNLYGGGANAR